MDKYKVIFLGTTDFSLTVLEELWKQPYVDLKLVISQPNHQPAKSRKGVDLPVKNWAENHKIPLQQPQSLKSIGSLIEKIKPDFLITAAYGQFIPETILASAQIEALNVHGSLLPSYRGGSPIQTAIWKGDQKTGVTIMRMVKKMDAGPIYGQALIPITSDLNGGELMAQAAIVGANLLTKLLIPIAQQKIKPQDQDPKLVSFAYNIQSDQEKINWNQSSWTIHNHIRALAPIPGTFTWFKNQRIKIFKTKVKDVSNTNYQPGTIIKINKNSFDVQTKDGILEVLEVQQAGKNKIGAGQFGMNHLKEGDYFTSDKT